MASTKKKRKRDEEKFEEGITKEAEEDMMKVEVEADVLVEEKLVLALEKKTFTLVAHDWGGAVAWVFAALHPEMLDNLIICNIPHITALEDQRKNGWKQKLKSWYMIFFQVSLHFKMLHGTKGTPP